MDPIVILKKYYDPGSPLYDMLLLHGRLVSDKSLQVARSVGHLNPDREFLHAAAMLHDIGIRECHAPTIGCHGSHPYVCHGILGKAILETEALIPHALVCERHVAVGLSAREIRGRGLPLPVRDMLPVTLEEKIICYADKFFSKNGSSSREKSLSEIEAGLAPYGEEQLLRFQSLHRFFSERLENR
jgi:uncharacterized protein